MINKFTYAIILSLFFSNGYTQGTLVYHTIQTDSNGNLLPWYNPDPGTSYDHDLGLMWNFWHNIPETAGIKFYMLDHSYSPTVQYNKVGGDQFAMILSSEELLYQYTGDTAVLNDMVYIANTYLANGLSASNDSWPNLPYPCNLPDSTKAIYAGDFLQSTIGATNVTQPDKAGSFGAELVTLYKITGDTSYLNTAINIANTMASKMQVADSLHSPYLFRVNAVNGSDPISQLLYTIFDSAISYSSNVSPTMRLFENLEALNAGNVTLYDSAYNKLKTWVRAYPEHDNQWGTFFEDIGVPSNTEINAVTMAYYILQHPNWSPTYQQEARSILDWTLTTFADNAWDTLGVTAIYEQSADLKPGGSHTSRYASAELLYAKVTGDSSRVPEAIRQLNWATYLTDTTGQTGFSPSETTAWYTDGYGDYVRHFLRSMSSYPAIAPDSSNHLLGSSSVITYINYQTQFINYFTFDDSSTEVLRVTSKPLKVKVNGNDITELTNLTGEGWTWTPYATGGVLNIEHSSGRNIEILWALTAAQDVAANQNQLQVYPNPASDNLTIKYNSLCSQPLDIQVLDMLGRTVEMTNAGALLGANTYHLDLSTLQSGSYLLRLRDDEGEHLQQFVIAK